MTLLHDFVSIRRVTRAARIGVMLVLTGVVALPAVSAAARNPSDRSPASAESGAANSARFSDPAADVPSGGMDITNVTVSNDDTGKITFVIQIPSHQTLPAEKEILVAFDTDRNVSTGTTRGNDYGIFVEGRENVVGLYRFDKTQMLYIPLPGALATGRYSNGAQTLELNRSALGGSSIFDFELYTGPEDFPTTDDFAPDTGKWTYEVKITPPVTRRLAITSLKRTPARPTAGESFTIAVTVKRVGWSGRFNGTVFCGGRIAGRQAVWSGSVKPGRASCSWKIPANAVGKTITGSIGVGESDADAVTRRFSARIVARKSKLSAGGASTEPDQPEAGRKFYYALTVIVHTGASERRLQFGDLDCKATVGGRALEVFEERILRKEGIRCGWEIPPGTTGRTMVGAIVVRSEGATLKHTFTRRIT